MTRVQSYCPDPEDDDLVFNIPTSGNVSRVEVDNQIPESDSDEAPDDVPFSASKMTALSIFEAQEEVEKRNKEEQKQRHKKKEAILREQKEKKLKRLQLLASKRLPEEIVETLSATHTHPTDNLRRDSKIKKQIQTKSKNYIRFEDEHYIPLTTGDASTPDFSVAILESKKWKNKFSKPGHSVPKDFRQKMLFRRSNKRETTKTVHQAREKQALAGKNAFVGN